jgi:Type I restriction enzyme R protein N terminus (HSDR_N)
MKPPKKVISRISENIKTYQTVAASHRANDVSEADTVTLVKDILCYCFGFDKYHELTSEQQIRGTYCDLAVKIDGKIRYLIEVKAAGVSLNSSHLRQAINYGANQGIEWVVLTNAVDWQLHRIKFGQPFDHEEISSFNFIELNAKKDEDLAKAFLLCREGLGSDAMDAYHQHLQMFNRYTIGQLVLSEAIIAGVRKELKKLFPESKIDALQIADILQNEVLKREVIEGDRALEAKTKIKRIATKAAKLVEKSSQQGAALAASLKQPEAGQQVQAE